MQTMRKTSDEASPLWTRDKIGADGKRSCVRQAAKTLSLTEGRPISFTWEEREENSWGVYIEVPIPCSQHGLLT